MPSTSVLFTPLQLGDIVIKNRFSMAALTRDRATKTMPNEVMQEYYIQRCNAGHIVTEAMLITPQG